MGSVVRKAEVESNKLVEMAVACPTEVVEDERGFTTAGDDHQFDPEAADHGTRRRKWTLLSGRRKRALRTLSMPVEPADLALDDTLKAGNSFLSPNTSDEESSSGTSTSRSRSGSAERKKRTRITPRGRDDSESESVGSPVSWGNDYFLVGRVWFAKVHSTSMQLPARLTLQVACL